MWTLKGTKVYREWLESLDVASQERIVGFYPILQADGPELERPLVGKIEASKHHNMKELVVDFSPHLYRIFFIFDVDRQGIFLLGGDKMVNGRYDESFYKRMIPKADALYDEYLANLKGKKAAAKDGEKQSQAGRGKGRR